MKIPKFLIADNSQELPDNIFVLHTQEPKFLVQFELSDLDKDFQVYWLDKEPVNNDLKNKLISDAEDFLMLELENQEKFMDDNDE